MAHGSEFKQRCDMSCVWCAQALKGGLNQTKWSVFLSDSPGRSLSAISIILGPSNVWSTAHHAIHLQFDLSANALEIRAVQNPKCIV
jgi:hypothetical protein